MVIFASSKEGFQELESIIRTGQYSIWVGGNVLTDEEISNYREMGIEITNFNNEIDTGNKNELDNALMTIGEHHPGERIWLESRL